ncbi:MAG TPA: alcohol dehydrogenase catalytic domain-containing protein [Acidimicrobiia bacterium]|jgi:L-iditol 2-dehydrogenase|nr:alcohol dehydrogenase catalytic domain-containing protein [Acidimicrobiia bacterium]
MSTMRAAVLRGWNDLAVEEVDVPEAGPGEVLLRVRACGLCGTDLKMVQGKFQQRGWPPSLPFVMGHEWSGEVVAIGEGLEDLDLAPGDKVVAENHVDCGRCPMCRRGRYNLCEKSGTPGYRLYGHTAPGALAEYAVRPAQMLHKLPNSVSHLEGALVNQGSLTVHALRRVEFLPGSTVAVFGPGLLGLLTAAVVSASGGSQIIMVGRGNRLNLAAKMGCDVVVDYEKEDPVAAVRRVTGGRGVDYVFDCTGNPKVLGQAIGVLRRGGRVAILGLTGGKPSEIEVDRLTLDEIDLMGIRSSPNAYPAMIALMRSGKVDVSPLVTQVYPLEAVGEALAALESRDAIRPIVEL